MRFISLSPPKTLKDYWILIYSPSHPRAFNSGYVPEQILVAEETLGRELSPDEEVRHKNGNTQDNRPSNLEIISAYSTDTSYRVVSVAKSEENRLKTTKPKSFVPCKFQKPCWKKIRAPIAKGKKVYLPYVCSFQTEGDIYKCSHFWNFIEESSDEVRSVE